MPRKHGRSYVFIAESELDHLLIPKRHSIDNFYSDTFYLNESSFIKGLYKFLYIFIISIYC